MIDKEAEIIPGVMVIHDEGLRYRVDDLRRSTAGYEATHKVGGFVVGYTQLEDGSFPAGTGWSKPEEEFRQFFTIVDETTGA